MKHKRLTKKFIRAIEKDATLKKLVIKNLAIGKAINPDRNTNPAQSLPELYDFLDWATECLPWNVLNIKYPTIYEQLDQCTGYFWFIFDQPLPELMGQGYYYPSLNYYEPIASLIKSYAKQWGKFLSSKRSWNNQYFDLVKNDPKFNGEQNWYGTQNIWHSFNDWFSRKLLNPAMRPIANTDVVSPADACPQGVYQIDLNNRLIHPVPLKSACLDDIAQLIGRDSPYAESFAGGTLTHTFLDLYDYHRYHFPIGGKILEIRKISGVNAGGGITTWDPQTKRYQYANETGFQMIETRDCMILDHEQFGLVAILPVGMSQVCSCNFEKNLRVGDVVTKGQPMGYFQFGGSDIVMIFQKHVVYTDVTSRDGMGNHQHLLTGAPYANLKIE